MQTLSQLAEKYNTDKLGHGYLTYYEAYLTMEVKKLLEIGCMHGASLRMWRDYFPEAEIHTFDLFINPEFAQEEDIKKEGFVTHKGDQSYRADLKNVNTWFDVIIDDGSHQAAHQIISFNHLFNNNLKTQGLYVIEDIHCNRDAFFRGDVHINDTFLHAAKNKNSWFWLVHSDNVDRLELHDDKILFIWKK